MLKVGYKASAEQFAPADLLRFSRLAEELGFDSVLLSDHFQPWRHSGGHAPASLPLLGAIGASTRRITIGTSVLTPTLRYHPSIVAQAFATLGLLLPGRVILGLGTGEAMNEAPATGAAFPEPKERFARLREAVRLIRQLWREERVSFAGEYYRTRNATIYDRPELPVPIYVAGAGPQISRYAGRSADGFICTSGKAPALYADTLLPAVAAGLAERKEPAAGFEHMIEMKVSYDTDRARALEDTRHWAALALSPEEKASIADPVELEKLADALALERTARRWIVSGDPEAQIEGARPYVAMGFHHLVLHAPGPDQERFLRLYAKDVLPRLRKELG